MESLIEIQCPAKVKDKYGREYTCMKYILKVSQGASGRAYCWKCRKEFEFHVEK